MTNPLSAGVQRPPPFPPVEGVFRTPARQPSVVVGGKGLDKNRGDSIETGSGDLEGAPLAKRRKIDSGSSPVGGLTSAVPPHAYTEAPDGRIGQGARLQRLAWNHAEVLIGIDGSIRNGTPPSKLSSTQSPPLLPLPTRPRVHSQPSRAIFEPAPPKSIIGLRRDVQVPNTPYKLESPDKAPNFKDDRLADFFPWIGNHPEDVLNEHTVRNGFIDSNPVSRTETESAKSSLHSFLKHRSGLQNLSSLFVSVLEQRQSHGKVASGSAFKPPPRVTLTEAKRKSWLSDLADSSVPLRKLSRTIPQGIRGQLLLDQCLTKFVPVSRAIWFAKCVGANEIRTLKRKGTSGAFSAGAESKWLKDWTLNVEQFIEATIDHCGQPNWRASVNYCLRLATRLYFDNLLDRDHYLGWIVNSTSASSLDRLPFWLMIIHTHSKDLTRFRERGRRLAEVLIEKLKRAQDSGADDLRPITSRLVKFIKAFVLARPACFIIPEKWPQSRDSLRSCLDFGAESEVRIYEHLANANERVSGPIHVQKLASISPAQSVIHILDKASAPFDMPELMRSCLEVCDEPDILVATILEWSSSKFRFEEACIYLGARFLRLLHKRGWDLDAHILNFLASQRSRQPLNKVSFHHLITELARSRSFSLSRYLQWLTARGGLKKACFTDGSSVFTEFHQGLENSTRLPVCNDCTQLLTEVSLTDLAGHVRSLRNTLLSRVGFSSELESSILDHCRCFIIKRLSGVFPAFQMQDDVEYSKPDFANLSWTIRSEIGQWLRETLTTYYKPSPDGKLAGGSNIRGSLIILTLGDFNLVRGVLEETGDLSMLADIVSFASKFGDESILASVTDTINQHFASFSAIGALNDLHEKAFGAYVSLKATGASLPSLTVSLIDLGTRLASRFISVKALQQDLARGVGEGAMAACSPFSDGMAESLQQAGSTFVEEFEAVLLTGNSMGEQTMSQLFSVLVERLEKAPLSVSFDGITVVLCRLLARLRVFRTIQFDQLTNKWVLRLISNPSYTNINDLLLAMISTGCTSLKNILNIFKKMRRAKISESGHSNTRSACQNAAKLISRHVATTELTSDPISYRFGLERSRYFYNSPRDALEVLAMLREDLSDTEFRNMIRLAERSTSLVSGILLNHTDILSEMGDRPVSVLADVLDNVLFLGPDALSSPFDAQTLITGANDFSLPFCRLRLQLLFKLTDADSITSKESIVSTLFSLANSEAELGTQENSSWSSLVSAIDSDAARHIREKAEESFFAIPLPFVYGKAGAPSATLQGEVGIQRMPLFFDIISKTANTIPTTGSAFVGSQIIDKLAGLLRYLGNISPTPASISLPAPTLPQPPVISDDLDSLQAYLPLLLRLTSLHRAAFVPLPVAATAGAATSTKQTQQDQVKILVLLTSIALHPALSGPAHRNMVSHTLDVAATLTDEISDEGRVLCSRFLKDKMRDPRAVFLFGSVNSAGETEAAGSGLQMVKEGKGVIGEWKIKHWELLEGGAESSLSLGLFQATAERILS